MTNPTPPIPTPTDPQQPDGQATEDTEDTDTISGGTGGGGVVGRGGSASTPAYDEGGWHDEGGWITASPRGIGAHHTPTPVGGVMPDSSTQPGVQDWKDFRTETVRLRNRAPAEKLRYFAEKLRNDSRHPYVIAAALDVMATEFERQDTPVQVTRLAAPMGGILPSPEPAVYWIEAQQRDEEKLNVNATDERAPMGVIRERLSGMLDESQLDIHTTIGTLTGYMTIDDGRPSEDKYFMIIARAVRVMADCRRRKVGAVIVKHGRIIAADYNKASDPNIVGCLVGGCPRAQYSLEEVPPGSQYEDGKGQCIAVHAEAGALLQAGMRAEGATLYCTEDPCYNCAKLASAAGIVRTVTS